MARTVLDDAQGGLASYYTWYEAAKHGDVLVYHLGDLAYDRDLENFRLDPPVKISRATALDALATRIFKDAEDGFIALTRRRIERNVFEYRATRVMQDDELRTVNDADLVLA